MSAAYILIFSWKQTNTNPDQTAPKFPRGQSELSPHSLLNRATLKHKQMREHTTNIMTCGQLELPRPIPRNSVESDHGCTSRIYFDNAGDNVMLTLYNVTLTSQKHNNKCDCSKINGYK